MIGGRRAFIEEKRTMARG